MRVDWISYRINECFFHAVEDNYSDEDHDQHKAERVSQSQPGGIASSQKTSAEGLNDRRDGVDVRHPAPFLRDARDRVDDRRGVHPQANPKTDQVLQIAILGGHGRDDDAKTEPQPSHQHQQQWQCERPGREPDLRAAQSEEGKVSEEEGKLDREGDQVGNHDGNRHHQAWKVNFAKKVGIGGKGRGGTGEAGGKVAPEDVAGHVKEHLRQTIGGKLGDIAEDDGEDNGSKQRLDDEPQRA